MPFLNQPKKPIWNETTALFGGRFDPPHRGHSEAVQGLLINPGVKNIIILPSAIPPHKPANAGALTRFEMTKLNFISSATQKFPPSIEVSKLELDRAKKNPEKPSYTFDTLQELQSSFSSLAFVIGSDQLAQLEYWHRFPEILTLCHWIILNRKPSGEETTSQILANWVNYGLLRSTLDPRTWQITSKKESFFCLVSTESPCISSTQIRQVIAQTGNPPHETLCEPVESYIRQHCLYGMKK